MKVRRIPGRKGTIMDPKQFPPNNIFYNPSVDQDGEYVYLRNTEVRPNVEYNHFVLYHVPTQQLRKIVIPEGVLLPSYNAYQGIEDVRIVTHKGKMWFTATSTHATKDMRNSILFGCLNADRTAIEKANVLPNFLPPAKNINPFVWKDQLMLLDAYEQHIYKVEEVDGVYVATLWKELHVAKGLAHCKYRGSTAPIHLHGNMMGYIVHDVIYNDSSAMPGSKLSYLHYWVEFDIERGVIVNLSAPFWCLHWGIEFVSGLRYDQQKQEVYLYFGVKDETPCLCTTYLHDLRCGK